MPVPRNRPVRVVTAMLLKTAARKPDRLGLVAALSAAEGDPSIGARAPEAEPGVAMRIQNAPGMRGEFLSHGREHTSAPGGRKKALADQRFQPLHLRRHGGGRTVDGHCRSCKRTAFGECEKSAQQFGIDRIHTSVLQKYSCKTIRFF